MPSIMGQAMEGAGPSMSGIGSWLGSLGGGGGGIPMPPSDTAFSAGGLSSSGDPNAGVGWNAGGVSLPNTVSPTVPDAGGGSSLPASWNPSMPVSGIGEGTSTGMDPNSIVNPPGADGSAGAGTSAFGAGGAPMAGSFGSAVDAAGNPIASPANAGAAAPPGSPASVMGQTTGQQAGVGGTPADQSWWKTLLLGSPADPSGKGGGWPGLLSAKGMQGIAGGSTDLLKYLQQRSLLDPSKMNAAARQIAQNQKNMLRKSIFPAITATGQETGQINAPYLMNQAYTTAAAPIVAKINEEAFNQWLQANQLAGGMYPDTGALGGLVNPNIFGGGARE